MGKKNFISVISFFVILQCFASGQHENLKDNDYAVLLKQEDITHRWFYFTDEGFKETRHPAYVQKKEPRAWTEAVRISSRISIDETGFFTVNKLGILICPSTSGVQTKGIAHKTFLVTNKELFANTSMGKLFIAGNKPVFSLYTNDILQSQVQTAKNIPLLVSFNLEKKDFTSILMQDDVERASVLLDKKNQLPAYSTLREFIYKDEDYFLLFKNNNNQKIDFFSYKLGDGLPLESSAKTTIKLEPIALYDFRELTRPHSFSFVNGKFQSLLKTLPQNFSFFIDYCQIGSTHVEQYLRGALTEKTPSAFAVQSHNAGLVVFEDGTVFFAGMLPFKHVLKSGEPIIFKLPKLPEGFMYGPALLAGSTLFVAWEETSFYATLRSGYIAVDLEAILYSNQMKGNL